MSARRRKARVRAHTEGVERYRGWQRKISERAVSPADAMAALLVGLFVFASNAGYGGDSSAYPYSENLGQREVFPGPPGPP